MLETTVSNLSQIPDLKPNDPHYLVVQRARERLSNSAIGGSSPVFEWIRALLPALEQFGQLNRQEWTIENSNQGSLIIHNDFLTIQDEFESLEPNLGLSWNAELAKKAMQEYLKTVCSYREQHNSYFSAALAQLNVDEKDVIKGCLSSRPQLSNHTSVLIALPSPYDNSTLWQGTLGLNAEKQNNLYPWSKIHESGVILASRLHRHDKPRGHDFFSYAARDTKPTIESMIKKLVITAQHEGSHFVIDGLLNDLLEIKNCNPIDEGIAGVMGKDGRDTAYTNLIFEDAVSNPRGIGLTDEERTKHQKAANYQSGPKIIRALLDLVQEREELQEEGAWIYLTTLMLKRGVTCFLNNNFKEMEENQKISLYLLSLFEDLKFDSEVIKAKYNELNPS